MAASKGERLAEFLDRLGKAPPAGSAEEALELVNKILDEVEDALSGIPYDPDAAQQLVTDGRMYGPHPSFASEWKDNQDVTRFAHTRHDTFLQNNGAILIRLRRPQTVLLAKPGANGKEVEL
ncbi:MAG: hypothetical protein AB7N76_21550 [Planctomycetota bacterium]